MKVGITVVCTIVVAYRGYADLADTGKDCFPLGLLGIPAGGGEGGGEGRGASKESGEDYIEYRPY